jgi:hypothetical protein
MSRRTKLWIAAVFVLLISGPIVYLALAWSPDNPLRFRVVDPHAAASADPSDRQNVVVEVENTSSFPLVFRGAELGQQDMRTMTMGEIDLLTRVQDPSLLDAEGNGMELIGGQRIHVVANMSIAWHRDATKHGANVEYYWRSAAKNWVAMRFEEVRAFVPERIWEFIPQPELNKNFTPLEPFARDAGS